MDRVAVTLTVYAKRVGKLRSDLLFDDPDTFEQFDEVDGAAMDNFVSALAYLNKAKRKLQLAAFHWEQEEER